MFDLGGTSELAFMISAIRLWRVAEVPATLGSGFGGMDPEHFGRGFEFLHPDFVLVYIQSVRSSLSALHDIITCPGASFSANLTVPPTCLRLPSFKLSP